MKKLILLFILLLSLNCFAGSLGGAGNSNTILVPNNQRVGTGTTYSGFYEKDGDLYSENGKAYFGSGVNVRAERYGIGYQMRGSSPAKTLLYDIDATFTAATGIIAKAGETFVSDGVAVEDFLRISSASDASYIGSTGEVIKVTETEITVSMAAAGAAVPSDLTNIDFVIINHPIAVFLDNGDIHFDIGVNEYAGFHIHSDESNGLNVLKVESHANVSAHRAAYIGVDANGNTACAGQWISYNSGALAAGETGAGIYTAVDLSGAADDDTVSVPAYIAGATDNSSAISKGFLVLPGFDVAFQVQGAPAINPDYGYEITTTTVVDRVNSGGGGNDAFVNVAVNVQLFDNDNDYILIGNDDTFEVIDYTASIGSNRKINAILEYSTGNDTWSVLSILTDTTDGFKQSGKIIFLTPGDWAKGNQAEGAADITSAYYVKITRTRNSIATLPTEEIFKINVSRSLGMDIRGDGTIKPAILIDADASNNSIYYSTDQSKLVYKDGAGAVQDLY